MHKDYKLDDIQMLIVHVHVHVCSEWVYNFNEYNMAIYDYECVSSFFDYNFFSKENFKLGIFLTLMTIKQGWIL